MANMHSGISPVHGIVNTTESERFSSHLVHRVRVASSPQRLCSSVWMPNRFITQSATLLGRSIRHNTNNRTAIFDTSLPFLECSSMGLRCCTNTITTRCSILSHASNRIANITLGRTKNTHHCLLATQRHGAAINCHTNKSAKRSTILLATNENPTVSDTSRAPTSNTDNLLVTTSESQTVSDTNRAPTRKRFASLVATNESQTVSDTSRLLVATEYSRVSIVLVSRDSQPRPLVSEITDSLLLEPLLVTTKSLVTLQHSLNLGIYLQLFASCLSHLSGSVPRTPTPLGDQRNAPASTL